MTAPELDNAELAGTGLKWTSPWEEPVAKGIADLERIVLWELSEAGRWGFKEATDLTHPNGPDGPRDGLDFFSLDVAWEFSPACPAEIKVGYLEECRRRLANDVEGLSRELELAKDFIRGVERNLGQFLKEPI